MNILIVKTSAIGDVTHTLPALHALRKHYPDARISWLIEEEAADLIKGHPALDRVLISKRKQWIKNFKAGKRLQTIKEIIQFIREIRDTEYELLIDFQGLLKSSFLIAMAKAKRKVGFGRGMEHAEGSYLFLNERVPPVKMDLHAVDRELMLLKAIGIESEEIVYDLPIDQESRKYIKNLLDEKGIGPKNRLVSINPMTTWQTKHWHNKGFAEVADRLLEQGLSVVFTGGPGDAAAINNILEIMRHDAVNLAGKTTLKTLAALYSTSRVVISTDTGPMHIAAAVGTPVVALFGPTAPWRTGPYGKQHKIVRIAALPCSPCLKRTCETIDCMMQITPDDVLKATNQVISD